MCGAALADLGFSPDMLRGFALLARTAGLLGHLAEEMRHPVGNEIYRQVDEAVVYQPPGDGRRRAADGGGRPEPRPRCGRTG